jgi:NADH-quinone oxidoreductase subunit N
MDTRAILQGLAWTTPEVVLVGFILIVILADLSKHLRKGVVAGIALAGVFFAALVTLAYVKADGQLPEFLGRSAEAQSAAGTAPLAVFGGAYAIDGFSFFLKLAFLAAALIAGLFSLPALRTWTSGKGEYFALLLSCTFGMLLMASANDLLMMYLALEFVSITSYIMAGLLRHNRKSAEASLKYIIYGAAASGFMIYGMSFLYGITGTLEIGELGRRLSAEGVPPTITLVTSVLVMAGFGYKIAAVPFHMWCPDVYEGAPTPVTAFFSVGPKAAGFAMLIRFLHGAFPGDGGGFEWKLVLALLAVLTMAVGNFGALQQQNLKRLLAYSSIAHAGYLLVAFNAFTPESTAALMTYLVIYVIMNLGAFLVVLVLEQDYGVETVDQCRGLGWRAPQLGALMTIFMVSLTGLPPTAGFIGKFLVFGYVVQHGIGESRPLGIVLVVVGVLFSVISLFYYMRIVAAMYLGKPARPDEPGVPTGALATSLLWILGAATLWFGVAWGGLQHGALDAARSLLSAR